MQCREQFHFQIRRARHPELLRQETFILKATFLFLSKYERGGQPPVCQIFAEKVTERCRIW
jgi:hypothetical protein